MADIGANLIADLLDSTDARITAASDRVQQGFININDTMPRVWIGRSGSGQGVTLGGANGVIRETWDVECVGAVSEDNDDGVTQALDLAEGVKDRWHGINASSNIPTLKGLFVRDHDDDFIPRNTGGADGPYVAALQVEIWRAST